MANTLTYGTFRTGRLWAAAAAAFAVLLVSLAGALFSSLEFDERCGHGIVQGPGRLLDIREQTFPPATICEYERGAVSAGATGWLGAVVWISLGVLILCAVLALLAEWAELPSNSKAVEERVAHVVSRTEKLRRTGTAFFVTASVFLLSYGLVAWPLLTGPSSACSAGGGWEFYPPETLQYSFFPPQATCMFRSGETSQLLPGWVGVLATALSVPMVIAGVGFVLAVRRWRGSRRQL